MSTNTIDARRARLLNLGMTLLFMALLFLAALLAGMSGCAAWRAKPATTAAVHQDITVVIADAGAVAQEAEKQYTAGKIPQTDAARNAINALVLAYNDAKTAYSVLLTAESVYQGAQSVQLAACDPKAEAATANCKGATKNAAGAKAQLEKDNAALSTAISAMASKASAVKTITAPAQ